MKIKISKKSLNIILVLFLLATMFARGILENLYNVGTIILDFSCVLIFISFFTWNRKKFIHAKKEIVEYFILSIVCLCMCLIHILLGKADINQAYLGYRSLIVYSITFLFSATCFDGEQIEIVYELLTDLGLFFSVFGIVQFVFRDTLPLEWLDIAEGVTFRVWGTNLIRVSGLVGTTIDYAQLCIFFVCLSMASIVLGYKASIFTWVKFILSILATFLTFGRAAVLGIIFTVVLIYLKSGWRRVSRVKFCAALFFILSVVVIVVRFSDSMFFYRFSNAYKINNLLSNRGHLKSIVSSIGVIEENPIVGFSVDLYKCMKVCGDGYIWVLMLQWGVLIALLYFVFVFSLVKRAEYLIYVNSKFEQTVGVAFWGFSLEIMIVSFVNSAMLTRVLQLAYFLLAGMVYSRYYEVSVKYEPKEYNT